MRKGISSLLMAAAALLLAGTAWATTTRINSMGGNFKFITVEDESNIFIFPSTIAQWGNQALIDNFDGATGEFGFHYALNKDAVLVLYGGNRRTFTFAPDVGGLPANIATGEFGTRANTVGLIGAESSNFKGTLGFGLRGGLDFGVLLSFFADNDGLGGEDQKQGPFGIDLDLGLGTDIGAAHLDVALGLQFGILRADDAAGNEQFSGRDILFDLGARIFMNAAPGVDVIPFVTLSVRTQSVEPKGGSSTDALRFDILAGADLKISPAENVSIYPGAGIRFTQVKVTPPGGSDNKDQTVAIPFFNLALDVKVTSWLDWRAGAVQLNLLQSTDNGTAKVKSSASMVHWATGFGLQFGDWTIDLNIEPNFFNRGPYFLTGNKTADSSGNFAMDAALRYDW